MSRKPKEEYHRFFSVTDPRSHEKGHTEYKVTARFVSKRHPDDVKEVVAWKRFSELKKLHGELAYTHRNLFRRQEEFPAFPRAQVFGRFDEAVIEERRKAAESMLLFTTGIPALYNSPQLKEFFRGGEVTRPLDPSPASSAGPLPPPLIPLPKRRASDCEPAEEEEGREAPTLPQDLGTNISLEVGEPEVAAEAYSEFGGSPAEEEQEDLSDAEQDDRVSSPELSLTGQQQSEETQEDFDSLFDSAAEELVPSPKEEGPPPLSENDLAVFDPCYKQETSDSSGDHSELFSLPPASLIGGDVGYLNQAAEELTAAMEREKEGELSSAIRGYRTAVDILITGVQGRFDEAVIEERRKAAESMLLFTTGIPALYNSPQLKEFFRGGEVTRPLDPSPASSAGPLPPPLIPLPKRRASDCEPAEEEEGREAPTLPQDLGTNISLEVGEPEVAAEAYSEFGGSPAEEEQEDLSDAEQDDRVSSPELSLTGQQQSEETQEDFDSLFDSAAEELVPSPKEEGPPPLSENDLAVFDPCYKQETSDSSGDHSELFSLPPASLIGGDVGYLNQAAEELTAAMEREKEGELSSAIRGYRTAVDILITGVQGDPDPARRESVMRRTAQYLKHAEMLVDQHASPSHTHAAAHTQEP